MDEESEIQKRIIKRLSDGSGSLIGVLVTASALIGLGGMSAHMVFWDVFVYIGLWTFTRRRSARDGLAAALLLPSAPVLQMSHFGRARRFTLWFLALLFHTLNALVYVVKLEKDQWCLLMKGTGLGIALTFCIGLVVLLHQSFPIQKDVRNCGVTFGFLYVVAATVTVFKISTWSDIVLGLIHTLITLFMSILRFSCQAGFLKFEKFPLLVAILGSIGGCLLPLLPLPKLSEFSAYKVATLIGGLSRLLDVIFIMGLVPRDKVNHCLVRLQEFLI